MDAGKLTFHYDHVGDILYVNLIEPYAGQESDMIDDFVVARSNPTSGSVENLEILFFLERTKEGQDVLVPITAVLEVNASA